MLTFQHGCNVNHTDSYSKSALWYAFSNSNLEVMRLLLKSGADKDSRNVEGQTILDEARDNDDDEVIELLTKFQKSWTWMIEVCARNYCSPVKMEAINDWSLCKELLFPHQNGSYKWLKSAQGIIVPPSKWKL